MSSGRIYVLSNESMPGLVKVGWTSRNVEDRVRELASTGVPTGFKIEYDTFVTDPVSVEKNIHRVLTERGVRTNAKREFFEISVPEAIALIQSMGVGRNNAEPDFSRYSILAEATASIELPKIGSDLPEHKASLMVARLREIGCQGYPPAFLRAAEIYEVACPSAIMFRTCWQEYLVMERLQAKRHLLASSNGREQRNQVGAAAAEYLRRLHERGWIVQSDFDFVGKFLVQGDQFEYEGYRNEIERAGYPKSLYEQADLV